MPICSTSKNAADVGQTSSKFSSQKERDVALCPVRKEARNDTLQSVQVRKLPTEHYLEEIAANLGQAESGIDRHLSSSALAKPQLDLNPVSQFIPDMISISAQQLREAASIKEKIDELQTELDRLLGSSTSEPAVKGKRGMSAAGRARIAAGQRARWAKVKGKKEKPAKKGRKKMSAGARAKIAAAARARWAKAKAAGRRSL